jgi:Domain of unknown function (DUF1707)
MASPFVPEPYDLRASDREREAVVEALRAHAASGRLDADELEQRVERAYAAVSRADLVPIVADLPAPEPARPRRRVIPDVSPLIAIAVLLIAIWAVTGAGYFWPMWPIGALALSAVKHRGSWLACGPIHGSRLGRP